MKLFKAQWDRFWAHLNPDPCDPTWYYAESDVPAEIGDFGPNESFSVCSGIIRYNGLPGALAMEIAGVFTRKQVAAAIDEAMGLPLVSAIKRWLAAQGIQTVVVEIPAGLIEELTQVIELLGGTIK